MNLNLFEKNVERKSDSTLNSRKVEIKRILEALLFSSSEPIPFDKLKEIISSSFPVTKGELKDLIADLGKDYKALNRAFQIDEIGGGYLLRTVKEMQPYLEMLHFGARGEKLSKACSEVLAIIAYVQSTKERFVTRAEIDKLRGVDSSGTLASLLERELVEVTGRLEGPGRPSQYGITGKFLSHFGLKSMEELKRALP